ncbi:MAG: LytR C-terminal domain-containing protein [Acidimicrobiales bacterium]|nr:LytR C-terminal domain-containing protein [Acidimicrobiales bacterium]
MARRRSTEPTANPARGAVLVGLAVVIGLFLLRNGLDTTTTVASPGDTSSDSGDAGTDEGDTTDEGTEDTVATTPVRPPSQVPLIVLNGSGVGGAAKRFSTAFSAAGYQLTNPDGANATANVPATQVLFVPGFEQEALAVATAIGVPATSVAPLGVTEPGSIANAQVVVVVGPDLGNTTPSIPVT